MKYPKGYYIYAYIDPRTNEVFYIGKGVGDRAWRHVRRPSYYKTRKSFFYHKLRKMLSEGVKPTIIIIKDDLTEETAYAVEVMLIKLVGKRVDGVGPLCNFVDNHRGDISGYHLPEGVRRGTAIRVWSELFASKADVARDPRCVVTVDTFSDRLSRDWVAELAATTPAGEGPRVEVDGIKTVCWGEEFRSRTALCKDSRCTVSHNTLKDRLSRGWGIERAATVPIGSIVQGNQTTCWGEIFSSKAAISRDPRCVVTLTMLKDRLHRGWNIEHAASSPPVPPTQGVETVCWGTTFPSRRAVADDSRCVISADVLVSRLRSGWDIEQAATTPQGESLSGPLSLDHTKAKLKCWGVGFSSVPSLCKDSRCVASASQIHSRLRKGWDTERAATTPINQATSQRSISEVRNLEGRRQRGPGKKKT